MTDLQATVIEECTVYPDGPFLLHPGETYAIDKLGNKGVVILTPFGAATLAWRSFKWSEAEPVCLPFDPCGKALCPECGDPRDTNIIPATAAMR